MSLLESDSKVIEDSKKRVDSGGTVTGGRGFKSLNRYKSLTKNYRDKKTPETEAKETLEVKKKITSPEPKQKPQALVKTLQKEPAPAKPKTIKKTLNDKGMLQEPIKTNLVEETPKYHSKKIKSYTDSKQVANGYPLDIKTGREQVANGYPSDIKIGSETGSETVSRNDAENSDDLDIYDFRELSGNQKILLDHIFSLCLREGSLRTGKVRLEDLALLLKTTKNTTKNCLIRLKKRNLIYTYKKKTGRSGWTTYGMSKELYKSMSEFSNLGRLTNDKQVAEQVANRVANLSSSSSINLIEKKSTTNQSVISLNSEWLDINIPQNVKEIRFGNAHLLQIFKRNILSSIDVQDSLDHFSYDLEHEYVKTYTGPLNMLMGVLIKQGSPYVSEKLVKEITTENEKSKKLLEEYRNARKDESEKALTDKFEEYFKK
ncbi:MAG: hypothetical protein ACI9QD_001270, partial [Thermoproteota archaeon]